MLKNEATLNFQPKYTKFQKCIQSKLNKSFYKQILLNLYLMKIYKLGTQIKKKKRGWNKYTIQSDGKGDILGKILTYSYPCWGKMQMLLLESQEKLKFVQFK